MVVVKDSVLRVSILLTSDLGRDVVSYVSCGRVVELTTRPCVRECTWSRPVWYPYKLVLYPIVSQVIATVFFSDPTVPVLDDGEVLTAGEYKREWN